MIRRGFLRLLGLAPLAAPAALASLPDDPVAELPRRTRKPPLPSVVVEAYNISETVFVQALVSEIEGAGPNWTVRILRDGGLLRIVPLSYRVEGGADFRSLRTMASCVFQSDGRSRHSISAEVYDGCGSCVIRSESLEVGPLQTLVFDPATGGTVAVSVVALSR